MGILYRVKTDRVWDECGAAFTVYGVTAYTARERSCAPSPTCSLTGKGQRRLSACAAASSRSRGRFWNLQKMRWRRSTGEPVAALL